MKKRDPKSSQVNGEGAPAEVLLQPQTRVSTSTLVTVIRPLRPESGDAVDESATPTSC